VDVGDHEVDRVFARTPEAFAAIFGFDHASALGLERRAQLGSHERGIVDNED
jgi:hypothetical protein